LVVVDNANAYPDHATIRNKSTHNVILGYTFQQVLYDHFTLEEILSLGIFEFGTYELFYIVFNINKMGIGY